MLATTAPLLPAHITSHCHVLPTILLPALLKPVSVVTASQVHVSSAERVLPSAVYQCFICWTPNLMRFTSFHLPNLKLPQNKSTIKPEGNSVLSTDDSFTSACRASTRHKQHCLSVFHVRISDCSLFTDLCDVTWPVRPPLGAGLFSIGVWWLMLSSAFLFSLNLIVVFWDLSRYVIIIRLKQCYTTHLTENFEDDSAADTMWYFISLHDND